MVFKMFGKKYRFNPPLWLEVLGGTLGLIGCSIGWYIVMVLLY